MKNEKPKSLAQFDLLSMQQCYYQKNVYLSEWVQIWNNSSSVDLVPRTTFIAPVAMIPANHHDDKISTLELQSKRKKQYIIYKKNIYLDQQPTTYMSCQQKERPFPLVVFLSASILQKNSKFLARAVNDWNLLKRIEMTYRFKQQKMMLVPYEYMKCFSFL